MIINTPVSILLVDDEPANLLALEAMLGQLGETLACASSGEEALKKVLDTDFAVILLDIRMPGMSGFEVARLIRRCPRSSRTPIIFVTASDGSDLPIEEAYALGAVDFLTEPVMPAALRARVAFFVELYRKTEDLARLPQEWHAAALNAKDEWIRLIMDNTRDYAFVVTDLDGRVTQWEGGAEVMTGWHAKDVIGQPIAVIFAAEDRAAGKPDAEMNKAKETGRADDKRWHVRKDGTRFFADGVMVTLKDAAGRQRGFAKIFRDATAERQADDDRRASEERFALLLESSGEGIYGIGPDRRCMFLNSAGAKMLGYRADELVGRSLHDIIHHHRADGSPYPVAECRIRKAVWDEVSIRIDDEVFWCKDGTPVPVSYSVYPMVDGGKTAGSVITFTDITERKRTEERLRASEELYRTLFESIDEGFCLIEVLFNAAGEPADYRFLEVNPAFEKQTGFVGAVGRTMRELVPDHDPHWFEAYGRVANTGVPVRFVNEAKAMGRWFDVFATRLGGPNSRKVAIVFNDITLRKRTEDELRRLAADLSETDRRKTEFLATLAHELRNPLAPIRTGLEVMRLGADNPATMARVRDMMERQVAHMVHLVNDLLDVARITRGKVDLKREQVELKNVVASAVETSLPLIESGRHGLTVHLSEEPLLLEVDPTRIAQVLSNLLNNAAKYTPTGGRIELSARRDGSEVVISVTDTGVGIPAESLSTVFEIFTQVGLNMDRAQGGLGIGLTLVRRLVELHGGTVTAASPGAGKGSTFIVRLPLASHGGSENFCSAQLAIGANGTAAGRFRVLVVDDNMDAAESLSDLLQFGGHTTRVANDGYQALRMVQEFRPEVVFLDIGMPGMHGYEVASALRKIAGMEQVALVALTGWGTEHDRTRSRDAGFAHHLTKPADLATVNALLSKLARSPDSAAPW